MFGAISEKSRTFDMKINFAISTPGRPRSPRVTEIRRTPIQGRKRILDSH